MLRHLQRCRKVLSKNVFDRLTVNVGETEVTALVLIRQARVVDSEAVKNRGVQIVNADGILSDVIAELVCLAVGDSAL